MSDWKICKVCKKCRYRKVLGGNSVRKCEDWSNTYCAYLEENDKLRDGNPTNDFCPNYEPRGQCNEN